MKKYLNIFVVFFLMFSTKVMADDAKIIIKNHIFIPSSLVVKAGTRVTWINQDQDPHTVSESKQQFHSGALDTNEQFAYIFNSPGIFNYFCMLHPVMIGKIIVLK